MTEYGQAAIRLEKMATAFGAHVDELVALVQGVSEVLTDCAWLGDQRDEFAQAWSGRHAAAIQDLIASLTAARSAQRDVLCRGQAAARGFRWTPPHLTGEPGDDAWVTDAQEQMMEPLLVS